MSFAEKQFQQSLESYTQVINALKNNLNKALKFEGEIPIFLDTNVLLNFYETSFDARDKFRKFLKTYKNRIVLTSQIQHEFIKHREKIINIFQATVTEQIPKSFTSDVINKLVTFKNNNKAKLEDYKEILKLLEKIENQANELLKQIKEKVDDKKGSANKLLLDDDMLQLLNEVKKTPNLDEETIMLIREEYNKLLQPYKDSLKEKKNDDETNVTESYSLKVFPGCAEKGNKEDPVGDFIIFHEMMQYAKTNSTDLIFMTNDTTKGDWLRKDGTTHLHYMEIFFLNTGQMIFIVDANRLLSDLFKTSFESLIENQNSNNNNKPLLNKEQIKDLLINTEAFSQTTDSQINDEIVKELFRNNIFYIDDLRDFTFNAGDILDWIKILLKEKTISALMLLRTCLIINNEAYKISSNGTLLENSTSYKLRGLWKDKSTDIPIEV